MSIRVAPTAMRIPISRVRSVTAISMMFMITTPPTTMPMATTAGMIENSVFVSFFQKSTSASAVSMLKSSSSAGRRRCASRMASCARSLAAGIAPGSAILTLMVVVSRRP